MSLNKNAIDLLKIRYCHTGEQPKDVFTRVANALSLGDTRFEAKLNKVMLDGKFLPNSPCLRNAGTKKGMLHACFVLPIEDDMDSISDTLKNMIIIFKNGGGVGINFSKLRPKDTPLSGGGSSSGVVSFMGLFDTATGVVKQGGFRRGALMGVLNFEHAEIMEFVRSKITNKLTNFNISVMVSDAFMQKVEKGESIDLKNPQDDKTWGTINAKTIFDVICFCAWNSGDPGFLFYDRINKDNILFPKLKIKCTNPCVVGSTLVQTVEGEKSIKELVGKEIDVYCMDEAGRLCIRRAYNIRKTGHKSLVKINTGRGDLICTPDHKIYTRNRGWIEAQNLQKSDKIVGLNRRMQSEKYCEVGLTNIEHLDNCEDVYDMTVDYTHNFIANGIVIHNCGEVPLPNYGACCLGSINLSALVKGGKFNHKEFEQILPLAVRALRNNNAVSWYPLPQITKVMKELDPIGVGVMGFADTLIKLGINYDSQESLNFIDEIGKTYKTVTDKLAPKSFWKRIIAPTGSLSIIADCSSGIEPIFETAFERHLTVGVMQETRDIYKSKFVRTAHQISPEWHLKVQAQWQKWCDGSISKTINMPNESSVDDIKKIYMDAWKMGCKGITVYRDGCKDSQVLRIKKETSKGSKCSDENCSL